MKKQMWYVVGFLGVLGFLGGNRAFATDTQANDYTAEQLALINIIESHRDQIEVGGAAQVTAQLGSRVTKIHIDSLDMARYQCIVVSMAQNAKEGSGVCVVTGDLDYGNSSSNFSIAVSFVDYEKLEFHVTLLEREI